MALVLRVRMLFRGTWGNDDLSPNSMSQQLISRGSLLVEGLGMPPELLQSAASETEVITCLRGRAQSQREHPRWDSVVEEPSSICLHPPKRRAAFPVGLSITLHRSWHPTPTGWALCVPPGTNTPMPGDAGAPSRAERAAWPRLVASSLSSQAPQSGTQHSQAPAPCKRKAAAGCLAKLCVGSFLATHGIGSYCFSSLRLLLQSLAKGSSICCLQVLSFTGHAGEEPAAWKVVVQGLSVGFLLSFPHTVPQRTLSNSSTCCRAELPCPCYTDASDITYSCPQKAKAEVAGPAQKCTRCPRKGAGPRKTAQQSHPLSSPPHEGRQALQTICCLNTQAKGLEENLASAANL